MSATYAHGVYSDFETAPPTEINDLFAFCNRLAWQAGGPVLIHDSGFGVIAYSTLQQPIDDSRRAIILRREVPNFAIEDRTTSIAHEAYASGEESFEIAAFDGIQTRRVVAPVLLRGAHVGSIWIAESAGPLHPDVHEIVRSASKQAALLFHLHVDARAREAEVFASLLLEGDAEQDLLAQYLGVSTNTRSCVIALCHGGRTNLGSDLATSVDATCAAHNLAFLQVATRDCMYVVVYERNAELAFNDIVKKAAIAMSSSLDGLIVGMGRVVARINQIPESRRDADTVVNFLRRNPGSRFASFNSIRPDVTLMRILEILDNQVEPVQGPLRELSRLSPEDRDEAINTLDSYFEFAGNATEAARHLCVHPNTFRYRLAKVVDLLGIDLTNRNSRLLVEIDLMRLRYGRA